MRSGKTQLVAIILAIIIAIGCGVGGGFAAIYMVNAGVIKLENTSGDAILPTPNISGLIGIGKDGSGSSRTTPATVYNVSSEDVTIAEAIADKAMPSVVGISTTYSYEGSSGLGSYGFWGWGFGGGGTQNYEATAVGTGVIVDETGYILTNAHVINDGNYNKVVVSLYDGSEVEGKVLWFRPTLDLAVVKIEADGLAAADLGDSDELKIGSYAAAIGNPLGLEFQRSMSQGIISGLDRSITVSNSSGGSTTMDGLLQTDATINSGNSGGPLYNSRGQVVGINTAKASSGEGMGFAIPINIAKPIVEEIKATGAFVDRYIGISGTALRDQTRFTGDQLIEYFGVDHGIYVQAVSENGGAEAAGMKQGDIILKVDGTEVNSMNKINSLLIKYKVGESVELTIMRDKQEMTLNVVLTSSINL